RDKVASMRWEDLSIDGVWTIRSEDREKGNGGVLVLPAMAIDIISAQSRVAGNPYVFPGRGGSRYASFGRDKATFDSKQKLRHWQLHGLRRTGRSLMSRAGVRPDVAERVLGHVMGGVEGIYNRHTYLEEKAHALRALAGLIQNIVRPEAAEVT